jgi:hypothetical protein
MMIGGSLSWLNSLLLYVEPAQACLLRVLKRNDGAPLFGSRELALAAMALRKRRLDECDIDANVLEKGRRRGEGRDVAERFEGGLEERLGAWRSFGDIASRIVGEHLDMSGTVWILLEIEGGEVFGDIPIYGDTLASPIHLLVVRGRTLSSIPASVLLRHVDSRDPHIALRHTLTVLLNHMIVGAGRDDQLVVGADG